MNILLGLILAPLLSSPFLVVRGTNCKVMWRLIQWHCVQNCARAGCGPARCRVGNVKNGSARQCWSGAMGEMVEAGFRWNGWAEEEWRVRWGNGGAGMFTSRHTPTPPLIALGTAAITTPQFPGFWVTVKAWALCLFCCSSSGASTLAPHWQLPSEPP